MVKEIKVSPDQKIHSINNILQLLSDKTCKTKKRMKPDGKVVEEKSKSTFDKMKEYGTVDYCAYATSAIREAKNNQMVLDLIKVRTSFDVQILSNSEHRFLMYKGLAVKADYFETVVDIDVDAYVPATYIKSESQKLDVYKRIAAITNEDVVEILKEFDLSPPVPTISNTSISFKNFTQ